nr:MAG TPA: hypothetical protein [Caudoviricetes sp.]
MNGVENKRILELEKENKRLVAKNKELEEKLEKANSIVMAYTNELLTREVMKGVWETQSPLASSQSDTEHSKQWYSERHQSDCIRINELTVALDTLVDRYANLRKIHGVS